MLLSGPRNQHPDQAYYRAPYSANPSILQSKQSLLGSLLAQSQSIFRIRRNKWALLKFLLLASLSVYLVLYIKAFLFSEDHSSRTKALDNRIVSDIAPSNGINLPEQLPLLQNPNINLSSPSTREPKSSQEVAIPPTLFPHQTRRKKRPIVSKFETRKRKLDEQLKTLMPIVPGWGDDGKGVMLTSEKDKEKAADVFKQGAYNVYISDRIHPNRSLHSVVAKECNDIHYNVDDLPNVSVIIIFTNEIFSALVRTVWSVINRTPKKLLKEIILVDDFSDKDYLKQTLHEYIDIYWNTLPKDSSNQDVDLVKLIRLPSRLGLIKARLEGAKRAQGDVLLFLDSHCEATDMWLEPLVKRIQENNKVFICPVIDIINDKTLEYNAVDPYFFQLGGFDWTGHFTWINRRESDAQKEPTRATKSPTMAGGLFAVDRKYFFEVGSYDEDMQIWGGENLELSFRVWQCGGRVEIHPCSHVGHIFRDFHPYSFNGLDSHGYNTLRTVLVWMDEYSKYFFMSRPDLQKIKSGDLTARIKLRNKLKCSSFKWYLDNVYDGRKFVYDQDVLAYGWLKNSERDLCLDVLNRPETSGEAAGLFSCEQLDHPLNVTTNQLFSYSKIREIRREEGCLTVTNSGPLFASPNEHDGEEGELHPAPEGNQENGSDGKTGKRFLRVFFNRCEEPEYVSHAHRKSSLTKQKFQLWKHELLNPRNPTKRLLINDATGECLTTEHGHSNSNILVTTCDRSDPRQHWEFQIYTNFKEST